MDSLVIRSRSFTARRVSWARTPLDRWRGLRGRGTEAGLLLSTRSIHTFGLSSPIRVIAIDANNLVRDSAVVQPGKVRFFPHAKMVLELPEGVGGPGIGELVDIEHE